MSPRSSGLLGIVCCALLVLGGVSYAEAASPPSATPDLDKLDGGLVLLRSGPTEAARGGTGLAPANGYEMSPSGKVLVDVYVDGSLGATEAALRDLGMTVEATYGEEPYKMVEGYLPVDKLDEASAVAGTQAIVGVPGEATNEGTVLSQGDAAHNGPAARALGTTGAGVKVGVISDSMDRSTGGGGLVGSQSTGNLPGPASVPPGSVTILKEGAAGSSDEGRAMAEIIFDTAPGIRQMYFAEGIGAVDKADSINQLVAAGVDVIADDTFAITEPFYQDGIVTQAADAARAAGVTYLVSAGNRGRQSWEGTYAPTTDPRAISPSANDFDPGAGADAKQTVGTFTNRSIFIELQWNEPHGGATSDYAVDLYGNGVYAFTVDAANATTGIPGEFVSASITGTVTVEISIRRKTGSTNNLMKYILGGVPSGTTIAEYATNSHAIDPDAASAKGALTVAASQYTTPATPEAFSSRGPAVTRLFSPAGVPLASPDVRAKPDLAAADGVATSVPAFNPFFGTSAAAPSAAGVAALILGADPALNADQVASLLTNTANATDCTTTAGQPDLDCGAGFIRADAAVAQALDASPPSISKQLNPAAPNSKGWFTGNVALSWTVSDTGSPVVSTTGCGPVSVTSDSVRTVTCSATSSGGTGSSPVTIKRDASKPVKVKIKGLKKVYAGGSLPVKSKVKCKAKDPTSGIVKCKVRGLKLSKGTHTAKATAINGAGLKTKVTFTYTIK